MKAVLDQAELFLTASACMAGGFGLLYLALGLYGVVINRAMRWFCVWGAIYDYISESRNKKKWWLRLPAWVEKITRQSEDS